MIKIGKLTEKKGVVVMTASEFSTMLGYLTAAQEELLVANKMQDSVMDSSDADPFKGARFYVGKGATAKAAGYLTAMKKVIEGRTTGS